MGWVIAALLFGEDDCVVRVNLPGAFVRARVIPASFSTSVALAKSFPVMLIELVS